MATVIWRSKRRERAEATITRLRPISPWLLLLAVVLMVAVTWPLTVWLYGIAGNDPARRLEAVKIGLTAAAGTGGALALLLAFRRQRSTEIIAAETREAQEREYAQRDRAAEANERDAEQRRITELYTKAADQLGSEKAPVRLAGLHALERLAQQNLDQRQTIVDVICAYLRMPYTPPDDQPPAGDVPAEVHIRYENRSQELQVRLSAQRILAAHLRPEAPDAFWTGIDLDLADAYLHRLDLTNCHLRTAQFSGAQFAGHAVFSSAEFAGPVWFVRAKFQGSGEFVGTRFAGDAGFGWAQFGDHVGFYGAKFAGIAMFAGVKFSGEAQFGRTMFDGMAMFDMINFSGDADFVETRFGEDAVFSGARFGGAARFREALFGRDARFDGAQFDRNASFGRAQFGGAAIFKARFGYADFIKTHFNDADFIDAQLDSDPDFGGARARPRLHYSWPAGWTTRDARTAEGEEEGWAYLVRVEGEGEQQPDREDRSDSEAGASGT